MTTILGTSIPLTSVAGITSVTGSSIGVGLTTKASSTHSSAQGASTNGATHGSQGMEGVVIVVLGVAGVVAGIF